MPAPGELASNERPRSGFALVGPSVALDPRTHAVRADLADIRLAGRVFAPHFAAAITCRAVRTADMMDARKDGTLVARLVTGDRFEMLEVSGDRAWGIVGAGGLVGYVDRDVLEIDE